MIAFLSLFVHLLVSPFKTQAQLEAEIVVLRHQLDVLRRRVPSKPKLTVADRLLFVWLYRLFPSVLAAITVVQPETIMRYHRTGFRLYWRWKSRPHGVRPKAPMEIRQLSREMSLANRLSGAPRIHGELLKLGIEVAQSTVAKYMARSGRGRSQTWRTFLHNHAAGIAAMDFLIVPTVGFKLLFVLVILRHQRRRLISLSVTANPRRSGSPARSTMPSPGTRRLTISTATRPTATLSPGGFLPWASEIIQRPHARPGRTGMRRDRSARSVGNASITSSVADPRRTSSSILPDVVFGRHNHLSTG
jgi:hypothetical protein